MTQSHPGGGRSSPRLDGERKKGTQGLVRSGHRARVEEWHDPQPPSGEEEQGEGPRLVGTLHPVGFRPGGRRRTAVRPPRRRPS